MCIVLGEVAHAQEAVQRARRFVAMYLAEFGHADRQVAVALDALLVEHHAARTVHRLQGKDALVLGLGDEHVVTVVAPVPGDFPEAPVHDVRCIDLDVTGGTLALAHVVDEILEQSPALGMPEHRAGRFFLEMEEVELRPQAAMVALFGFFEHGEVSVLVFLFGPGGAVDALQLLVLLIAAPVGSGNLHQLEDLELARRGDVWATAEIDEIALAVERDFLAVGNGLNQFGLVMFSDGLEEGGGLITRPDFAQNRQVAFGEFGHALFNGDEILRREGALVGEIVVEAVVDDRADGHLCLREELLDRVGQEVCGRVAEDFQPFRVLVGDDAELGITFNAERCVNQTIIDAPRQRGAGKACADTLGNFSDGDGLSELALRTIRQGNDRHFFPQNCSRKRKKPETRSGFSSNFGRRDWNRTNDLHDVNVAL